MTEIRLEVASENAILEIQYDGHELRQPPLSMSEQLSQHARKIDFGAAENGGTDDISGHGGEEAEEMEEEEEEKPCQQPHWPLESVRNKIRNAHTEICVLHDLMQMVREKRYLVLDHVMAPQHQPKLYIQFLALKKSLSNAAGILVSGAERIRSSQSGARTTSDFHIDLLRLRQNWRLKRVATNIVGDLSYTTMGSNFKHSGHFEVSKADDETPSGVGGATPLSSLPGSTSSGSSPASRSSLRVTIPPELDGSAYIFVCIRKDEEDLCSTQLNMLGGLNNLNSNPSSGGGADCHWQQKLECAQNVLFCKELFSQLAREAVALKMDIPPLVVANQITATIFPGIHLLIALCHSHPDSSRSRSSLTGPNGFLSNGAVNGSASCNGGSSSNGTGPQEQRGGAPGGGVGVSAGSLSKSIHDGVLEHSLHQLMHDYLHRSPPTPHPVYAPLHAHPTRRLAGPHGLDRTQLMQTVTNETLLEQIIQEAQHNFLRLRTMFVIDQLAIELRDPLIISHWNLFNSPTQSCVRINIVTQGYDSVIRTTLVVHVYERSLRCVCRDGRVMTMSFEPQELRNLLLCQVAQHQMAAVQSLSKMMGWTVGCSEPCLGVGAAEPLGSAAAVVLTAPTGNKQIMVRSGPCTGLSVSVATAPRNDFYPSAVVQERRWDQLPGAWQEVRLATMDGRNFLAKIEMLMAALTAQI